MTKDLMALIGSIQKFSTEDGPGIRTTVFLKGCPLNCLWCHNPELIDPRQQIIRKPKNCVGCGECVAKCPRHCINADHGVIKICWENCSRCMTCADVCYAQAINRVAKLMTVEEVMKVVLQDKRFYDHTDGGMTISGGELLMHERFAEALIRAAKKDGIDVCLDTSGYGKYGVLQALASYDNVSAILYDMKVIDNEEHKRYTGYGNRMILENLARLAADPSLNPKIRMRMPLIKDVNDSQDIIEKTCEFYLKHNIKKVTLIAYHEMGLAKMRNIGEKPVRFETPDELRINSIYRYFMDNGLETDVLGAKKPKRTEG